MPSNVIPAKHRFIRRGAKFPLPPIGALTIVTALHDEERRLRILGLHPHADYMRQKANALLASERCMQYEDQNPAPDKHHRNGKPSRTMAWLRGCALTDIGAEGIYTEIGIDPADIDRLERQHRAQVYTYLKSVGRLDPTGEHETLIQTLERDGHHTPERNRLKPGIPDPLYYSAKALDPISGWYLPRRIPCPIDTTLRMAYSDPEIAACLEALANDSKPDEGDGIVAQHRKAIMARLNITDPES